MQKTYEFTRHSFPIQVFFAPSDAHFRRFLKQFDPTGPQHLPETAGVVVKIRDKTTRQVAVCIGLGRDIHKDTPEQLLSVIVHEIVHCVQYMQEAASETTFDNETEAYMVQGMMLWCMWVWQDYNTSLRDKKKRKPPKK